MKTALDEKDATSSLDAIWGAYHCALVKGVEKTSETPPDTHGFPLSPYYANLSELGNSEAGVGQPIYIGSYLDNSTNLNYLNARYYNPSQGQFLTQDPVFLSTQENLQDPQSLNPYSYSEDNPVTKEDPNGRNASTFIEGLGTGFVLSVLVTGAIVSAPVTIPATALTTVAALGITASGYGAYANYQAYENGSISKNQFDYNSGSLLGGLALPVTLSGVANSVSEAAQATSFETNQPKV